MMRSRVVLSTAAALIAMAFALPAQSQVPGVIVAGPGSYLFAGTYYTPAAVAEKDGTVTLVNADIQLHDVVAVDAYGPQTQPWCTSYPLGKCPLFWTPLVALGQTTELQGTENLTPGETYKFKCSIHPWMQGTLATLPNT
jgi:plastocyanin